MNLYIIVLLLLNVFLLKLTEVTSSQESIYNIDKIIYVIYL